MVKSFSSKISFAAIAILSAMTVFSVAPASATTTPSYYPSGPQTNVSANTLTDAGWTLCWSEAYGGVSDMNAVQAGTDDHNVVACDGDYLILTGWDNASANTLITLAAAPRADIFTETPYANDSGVAYPRDTNGWNTYCWTDGSIHTAPHQVNGTYWYYTPGCDMGFSPVRALDQWPGDSCWDDGTQPQRLSWHMYDGANPTSVNGGYSLGSSCWLNSSTSVSRAIYTYSGSSETTVALANTGINLEMGLGASFAAILTGTALKLVRRRKQP